MEQPKIFTKFKCADLFCEQIIDEMSQAKRTVYTFCCFDCSEMFSQFSEIIRHIERKHLADNSFETKYRDNLPDATAANSAEFYGSDPVYVDVKEEGTSDGGEAGSMVCYSDNFVQGSCIKNEINLSNEEHRLVIERLDDNDFLWNSQDSKIMLPSTDELAIDEIEHAQNIIQYKCEFCPMTFKEQAFLNYHRDNSHNDLLKKKPYKCDQCHFSARTPYNLRMHKKRHKDDNAITCLDCETSFNLKADLKKHFRCNHERISLDDVQKKTFTCTICNKDYRSRAGMTDHFLKEHSNIARFKCELCDMEYLNLLLYERHMSSHVDARRFECDICHKRFNSKLGIGRHIKVIHVSEKRYKCDRCEHAFHLKANFEDHYRTHTGERVFQCTMCDKSFIQKQTLASHLNWHTGQKKYQCEICGASFCLATKLRYHKQRHTGIKPFKCSQCDFHFFDKCQRAKHEKSHLTEKTFPCTICNTFFKSKKTLRNHSRLHTNLKTMKCRYCSMTFAQSAGRRGHERNQHENK